MNSKNKRWKKWVPVILLSFLGTVSMENILAATGEMLWYSNSIFSVFVFMGSLYLLNRFYPNFQKTTRRNKTYAVLFAFLLSTALHMGGRLEAEGYVVFTDIWLFLSICMMTLFLAPVCHTVWDFLLTVKWCDEAYRFTSNEIKEEGKVSILTGKIIDSPLMNGIIIFILWLPTFLAFFPGAFVYDAQDEYVEVAARVFTTHHPLLHVLLLGVPIRFFEHFGFSANVGIACYTILQMLVLTSVFSFALWVLKKHHIKRLYRGILLAAFGIFPIFPMYAVCSAKDTLFSACLLMVILLLYESVSSMNENQTHREERRRMLFFVVFSVLMMLFRNNGLYAYAFLLIVFIFTEFASHKKIILLMLVSILLFKGANSILTVSLQAKDSEHQEILTVPIQQLARVYAYEPDTFTEEEKELLFTVLSKDALTTYTPKISDIIKSQFKNEAYDKNPQKYQKLWLTIGLKKPMVYLNAWFLTSFGYWYPDAVLNSYGGIQRFTFVYQDSSYFGFETEPPGERHSLFPILEEGYRKLSLEIFQQKVPVISMLFSPGFLFWVFMTYFVWLMREKKKKWAAVFSIVPFLWLTVIFGPTTLVRYMLILWFVIPLLPLAGEEL